MTRDLPVPLGFVGGTGPQGRGLAVRFARVGYPVWVGSRDAAKAQAAVADLDADGGRLQGATNLEACEAADIVFVTVPYEGQQATLPPLADAIGDKIVVNCVNALTFDGRGAMPAVVEGGSAAEECQALLPNARVVSAFHDVSARRLLKVSEPITVDVLICGDDEDAKHHIAHLAAVIPGMWGVDAGPLRMSAPIEAMTAVLLAINRRYRIHSGLRIDGIERTDEGMHAKPRP